MRMRARNDYWCHPQAGGHRTLYFLGHQHIARAEYVEAVGAADCDPHIFHGRMTMAKKRKKAAKRELIDTGRDKRYVRRSAKGRFKESDDVGRSLSADRRRKAKTRAKAGQGVKENVRGRRLARRSSQTKKNPGARPGFLS